MFNQVTYKVLIERLRAFASGHYMIKEFTNGDLSAMDIEKETSYPLMHIRPVSYSPDAGVRTFTIDVVFADLPRDKENSTGYQTEVISDCIQLLEDLVAEVRNGGVIFGTDVELTNTPSAEVFIAEFTHTLCGVRATLTLSFPWDWSACIIPADWAAGGSGSGGGIPVTSSLVIRVNGTEAAVQNILDLTAGTNVTIEDLGDGRIRFTSTDEASSVWGYITGNILDQLDLQLALDAKANEADLGTVAFSNDYNDLDNLPTIPAAQVNADWNATSGVEEILNKPDLAEVATSGDYNDLLNLPTIPAEQVNSDWNATSGKAEILNKPTIPAAQIQSDWNQTDNTQVDFIKNKPTIPSTTGFVPYTGATNDLDMGTHNVTADHITLNVNPSGAGYVVGTTQWNNTLGSSETLLKGGNVSLKNGVDLVARVVNKVTPNQTLTKAAYQAVRVSGATGGRLSIQLAQANNDNNSADTLGIVTETIATNQEGFIMVVGQLSDINTTGSLQGETWADGDVLYLSPTTAGRLTNIKPTGATGHIVVIGYVEYAHATQGSIYVKVMNGWELDELHNVNISSPTNNQVLRYNSSTTLWQNDSVVTVLGYTPVPETRTITIDGTTFDLSANRTFATTGLRQSASVNMVSLNVGINTTTFTSITTVTPSAFNTENVRQMLFGTPVTFNRLSVITNNAQTATGNLVFTLRVAGADTALSLTIIAGSAGGTFTATTSVSVGANDRVAIKVQNTSTSGTSATIVSISTIYTI